MTPPSTADLADVHDAALRYCPLDFRDVGGRRAFFGRVRTLSCRDDNALLQRMIGEPGQRAVLVVDGQGSLATALVGDQAAARALAGGWAGFVIAGAVRDVAALRRLPIGLKCLAVSPRRSGKTGSGVADSPILLGPLTVAPGDWAYADEDGVVFASRPLHLDAAL